MQYCCLSFLLFIEIAICIMRKEQKETQEEAGAGKRGAEKGGTVRPEENDGGPGANDGQRITNDGERITNHLVRKRWPPGGGQRGDGIPSSQPGDP